MPKGEGRYTRGDLRGHSTISAEERFSRRVEIDEQTGCHLWVGSNDGHGYGVIMVNGRAMKAHRYAWERENGPVPEGLILDHLCRNPACVNPAHLEPVTERENILRGTCPSAINAARTHCKRGHLLDEENTGSRNRPGGRPYRLCRICRRKADLAAWHRNKHKKESK